MGFVTVRETLNTCLATAKGILDEAYDRLGLPEHHTITNELIKSEQEELQLYDYILSGNSRIEDSLIDAGVSPAKILRSTFGWAPSQLASSVGDESRNGFRALFIGGDVVRKGLPQLLAAWEQSGVIGELVIVGGINDSLKSLLVRYLERDDVRLVGFTRDIGPLYKSADIFVFPSLEEGDPQVTYQAAGCGLPVITTAMGSASIIKNGFNGLIVKPYDVDGLADAISRLASSPELRRRLGTQGARDAQNYTYERVGLERAKILCSTLAG
jgi:glycosyltransferase involved in cell wall biosynthesis